MKRMIMKLILLLGAVVSAQPAAARQGPRCRAEVLRSQELPGAPIDYHRLRAAVLIIPPSGPAFQETLEKLIPWQAAPPRRGQRFRYWCDAARPGNVPLFD
jgi:hypothetical protein